MGNHTNRFEANNQSYASLNMSREKINEDLVNKVDNFLKKGGEVVKKIPLVKSALTPVGAGRKTPTATSGGYRPVTSTTNTEEFENWVYSLMNEGYDLSEYTWDELYEEYITEIGVNFGGQAAVDRVRSQAAAENKSRARIDALRKQRFGSGGGFPSAKPNKPQVTQPTSRPSAPASASRPSAPASASRPSAPASASRPSAPLTSTGAGSAKVAPTRPQGKMSSASTSTPEKIKSGMEVWKSQMKSGDLKGATETGKNISALKYGANFTKPKTPNPLMKENSTWGSTSRIVNDISDLYQSIYEGKKKDQDQDGDNDFADVTIARMIASGMSKEEAIRKVKNKTYNEQVTGTGMGKPMGGPYDDEVKAPKAKVKPSGVTGTGMGKPMGGPYNDEIKTPSSRIKVKPSSITGTGMGKPMGGPYTEEFELWVHSLVEEGYDLSEYTWDEMYEIYEETAKEKEERIAKRRARVSELQSQGRVMTSSQRTREKTSQRKRQKREEELERKGEDVIRQVQGRSSISSDKPMGSEPMKEKEAAPEATRRLRRGLKRDTLGTAADDVLRKIKNEHFESWKEELIEEGYNVEEWKDEELLELYVEIFNSES